MCAGKSRILIRHVCSSCSSVWCGGVSTAARWYQMKWWQMTVHNKVSESWEGRHRTGATTSNSDQSKSPTGSSHLEGAGVRTEDPEVMLTTPAVFHLFSSNYIFITFTFILGKHPAPGWGGWWWWRFMGFTGGLVCTECLPNHQHLPLIAHCPGEDWSWL